MFAVVGTVLQYLQVFVSWPFLGTAVIFVAILLFRKAIVEWIERVSSLSVPGAQFQAQPKERVSEIADQADARQELESQVKALGEYVDTLRGEVVLSEEQAAHFWDLLSRTTQELEATRRYGFLWRWNYLNLFFVPHTKVSLNFLCRFMPNGVTREYFAMFWNIEPAWGGDVEREAVLNALQTNGLVVQDGNMLKATDEALRFLEYVGFPLSLGEGPAGPTAGN